MESAEKKKGTTEKIGRDHILPGLVSIGPFRHADQGGRRHCVLELGWRLDLGKAKMARVSALGESGSD
jgi:hypothetical protein